MSSTTKQTMSVVVDNAEKLAIITLAHGIGYGYGVENWNEDIMTAKNAGAEKVILKINSPGGDVITGLALYDEIKNSPLPVTAQVFGEASSAATLVALGASRVEMSANSLWMVHEMRGGIYGTEGEIRAILDKDFHANVEKVITIYAEKTGMSREAVLAAQKEELYLNAQEAMEKGWVDAVIGAAPAAQEEKPEEKEPEQKPGMVRGTMEHLRKLGYMMLGKDTPEAREMKATLDRLAAEQKAAQESAEAARAELTRLQESLPELIEKAVATRVASLGMSAETAPGTTPVSDTPTMTSYTPEELRAIQQRYGNRAVEAAVLTGKPL